MKNCEQIGSDSEEPKAILRLTYYTLPSTSSIFFSNLIVHKMRHQ